MPAWIINTWLSERVRNKLQEHKDADENFFLWASFPDPHTPYALPEPWASMYSEEDIIREVVVPGEHDANPLPHQTTQDPNGDFSQWNISGKGNQTPLRDHVLVQNRHEVDSIFLNTYVNERYKLTVYFNQPHGELWDLQEDPDELRNRWDDPAYLEIKADLMLKLNFAQMGKDPVPMPRLYGA